MADRRNLTSDWLSQIQLGRVPDVRWLNKFGENPVVNTTEETIWNGGGSYTFMTTGTSIEATSTLASGGTGLLKVVGLDENWDWQEEYVRLTNQTPAAIPGSWTMVHRAYVADSVDQGSGSIYIAESTATYVAGVPQELNLTKAKIDYGNTARQTQLGIVVVPRGHTALVFNLLGSMRSFGGAARTADVALEVAELAYGSTVSSPLWTPRRRVLNVPLNSSVQIQSVIELKAPLAFDELTRLELRGEASADSILRGRFGVLLVPNV